MNTQIFSFDSPHIHFKQKALLWAEQDSSYCLLNSNSELYSFERIDWLLAVGCKRVLESDSKDAFERLKHFNTEKQNNIYGYLSYDLKNDVEALSSENTDYKGFPELYFFEPEHIIHLDGDKLSITSDNPQMVFDEIFAILPSTLPYIQSSENTRLQAICPRDEYIKNVKKLQEHILEGDLYEVNYCIEFCVNDISLQPANAYLRLNDLSPMPFSSLLKAKGKYILCTSPERFLKKENNKLVSQPIKGTIKRSENAEEDLELKAQLRNNLKEIAENIMIVDLVRNDLTKYAKTGSIKAEELFGIYTYPNLHQMISTITAELSDKRLALDALKNAFPMGSMTGAPKVMAMQLIEQYEKSKRGVYSGAMGYIDMQNDFDFNVLIRSVFYDHQQRCLSFQVGGAITYDSIPEAEYDECLLKAKAILDFLPFPLS